MPIPLIWYITVAFGLLFWSVVAAQYIWPAVSKRERTEALRPFLVLHGFRYIGMVFLVPGVYLAEPEMLLFDPGSSLSGLCAKNLLKVEDVGQGAQVTILSDCRTPRNLRFAASYAIPACQVCAWFHGNEDQRSRF